MRYIVVAKDGIVHGATGQSWRCGQYIAPHALNNQGLWRALVAEGVVKAVDADAPAIDIRLPVEDKKAREPVISATPTAVARAAEHDVDLATVTGSGKDGRITAADVDLVVHEREQESDE